MPTAVVIGANAGIGHSFAKLLINEGYQVYGGDNVKGDGLDTLSTQGAKVGEIDVTSPDSIQAFKSKVVGETPIDILLQIAGIAVPSDKDSLSTTNLETLQKIFAVNSFGPFLVAQALLPNLLKSPHPKIAIMTSRVGSISDNSSGGMYAYRSSKAAANQISRNLAMDLKERGVVVMAIHPGFVRLGCYPGMMGRSLWIRRRRRGSCGGMLLV